MIGKILLGIAMVFYLISALIFGMDMLTDYFENSDKFKPVYSKDNYITEVALIEFYEDIYKSFI